MRRSIDTTCLLLSVMFLPFCSSRDTITEGTTIRYPGGTSLVSAGKRFELGFFSPKGSSHSYIGIWCYRSDPRIVVWVARRNDPPIGRNGSFGLVDGNLQLWNGGQPIQLTHVGGRSSSTPFAKLLDTGNLVLMGGEGGESILWQSFDNPTDTFLPGMWLTDDFVLTSWASQDDPKPGNFTFRRDQEGDANKYEVIQNLSPYWKSGVYGKFMQADEMFDVTISFLLSNSTSTATSLSARTCRCLPPQKINDDYRLVMNYDGQIQYFTPVNESKPVWSAPTGRCSKFNACSKFQSCNDKNSNETMCRCLPGFELHLGGCLRKSPKCGKTDTFLNLKMMKAGKPDNQIGVDSEKQCKQKCLDDCNCQACSFTEDQHPWTRSYATCYTWSEDLNNIQEFAQDGSNLYVRVQLSDIG